MPQIFELETVAADAKLAEAIGPFDRTRAEIATNTHFETTVNKAIVKIVLAQLLIVGCAVAVLKLLA